MDRSRLEMYGRAFTLEDDDEDGIISYEVFHFYVYTRGDNESEFISKKGVMVHGFRKTKQAI